jgi:hypothetical protein
LSLGNVEILNKGRDDHENNTQILTTLKDSKIKNQILEKEKSIGLESSHEKKIISERDKIELYDIYSEQFIPFFSNCEPFLNESTGVISPAHAFVSRSYFWSYVRLKKDSIPSEEDKYIWKILSLLSRKASHFLLLQHSSVSENSCFFKSVMNIVSLHISPALHAPVLHLDKITLVDLVDVTLEQYKAISGFRWHSVEDVEKSIAVSNFDNNKKKENENEKSERERKEKDEREDAERKKKGKKEASLLLEKKYNDRKNIPEDLKRKLLLLFECPNAFIMLADAGLTNQQQIALVKIHEFSLKFEQCILQEDGILLRVENEFKNCFKLNISNIDLFDCSENCSSAISAPELSFSFDLYPDTSANSTKMVIRIPPVSVSVSSTLLASLLSFVASSSAFVAYVVSISTQIFRKLEQNVINFLS